MPGQEEQSRTREREGEREVRDGGEEGNHGRGHSGGCNARISQVKLDSLIIYCWLGLVPIGIPVQSNTILPNSPEEDCASWMRGTCWLQ